MATIPLSSNHPDNPSVGIGGWKWTALTETDTDGAPLLIDRRTDRTVQVIGTFGGTSVSIEGSNDGTNWSILNDLQGAALTFTTTRLEGISEMPLYIRPKLTGGTGASITVLVTAVGRGA